MRDLSVGDVIHAGELVLLTGGSYSSYGIIGLFRATQDTTVPGRKEKYSSEQTVDAQLLSTLLEEVPCAEAWSCDD